ncbi:phosphoglucosamine mutase [Candidatus Woesearchaeota archaeon]|nr:phosphoglucosamine mutase [Candidatus Woesearchaeota archaeon]
MNNITAKTAALEQSNRQRLFGTDGIRGIAGKYPLDDDTLHVIVDTFAKILREESPDAPRYKNKNYLACKRLSVVIGRDTRYTGEHIEELLVKRFFDNGVWVHLAGVLPTPAIALATRDFRADAGIMISASHNPPEYNGIKFFGGDGFKLSDRLEKLIEEYILESKQSTDLVGEHIRNSFVFPRYRTLDIHLPAYRAHIENILLSLNPGSRHIFQSSKSFEHFSEYRLFSNYNFAYHTPSSPGAGALSGLTIAFDAANGAAYHAGKTILEGLGATVFADGVKPNGCNINAARGSTYPESLVALVRRTGADVGFALDGDADRVVMCDEKGQLIDGDRILAIAAIELKRQGRLNHDTVVSTVMTNAGFDVAMRKHGIKTVKSAVGDKYVIECMRSGDYVLGGEQSGHIIFGEHATTGDGLLAALQILSLMKREMVPFSKLADVMEVYPQVLINIPVSSKPDIYSIDGIQALVERAEHDLGTSGRVLLRYSGTESKARVMVEAPTEDLARKYAQDIADVVRKSIGT